MSETLPIRRRELDAILQHLQRGDAPGALVLGMGGSGKTVLARMLQDELRQRDRSAFYVPLNGIGRPGEVGRLVLDAVEAEVPAAFDKGRILQSSAGAPLMSEVVEALRVAGAHLSRPVLILDGLDEASDPEGTASVVAELGGALSGWQMVVASRSPVGERRFDQPDRFGRFQLSTLTHDETAALLRELVPEATDEQVSKAFAVSGGLPLVLWLLAGTGLSDRSLEPNLLEPIDPPTVGELIERQLVSLLDAARDAAQVQAFLEKLALVGGRERMADLTAWSGLAEEDVVRLSASNMIMATEDGVVLLHDLIQTIILRRRLRERPFQLTDLRFGAEDAERDDLLEESFVPRQNLGSILTQRRSIVVGDRGSGKSAIFRKLSTGEDGAEIFPVANTSDLLQKIAGTAAQDADTLRAVWLVVVAAVVAAAVPESAPKKLRREAAELRAAVGLPTLPVGRVGKALRAVARPFAGTTLSFAVGPVNLEAHLPAGGRPSTATVDVESFLQELDRLLKETGRRVVVLFDRIDELFKYDRARQEAVVQGLLQVEGRISMMDGIALVVFLRTDLFELYDIQEKNKLVSRRLVLEWSENDWLQVLVRRVLANESLDWVADRLQMPGGGFESQSALGLLFPAEVEGRPIDRWLLDNVRNGNGDVSPRLAVLLLYLARDYSARQSANVDALPLFAADAVARAMTEVSELSFSEVVNDFKVAPTFVLNCRAGKRTTFSLAEVEKLFGLDEGPISEQVRLLERLGFLERVVVDTDAGAESLFRIPALYTRCWDHS